MIFHWSFFRIIGARSHGRAHVILMASKILATHILDRVDRPLFGNNWKHTYCIYYRLDPASQYWAAFASTYLRWCATALGVICITFTMLLLEEQHSGAIYR